MVLEMMAWGWLEECDTANVKVDEQKGSGDGDEDACRAEIRARKRTHLLVDCGVVELR